MEDISSLTRTVVIPDRNSLILTDILPSLRPIGPSLSHYSYKEVSGDRDRNNLLRSRRGRVDTPIPRIAMTIKETSCRGSVLIVRIWAIKYGRSTNGYWIHWPSAGAQVVSPIASRLHTSWPLAPLARVNDSQVACTPQNFSRRL
jgi:hypothetical protein